jgi:hypothetical protein
MIAPNPPRCVRFRSRVKAQRVPTVVSLNVRVGASLVASAGKQPANADQSVIKTIVGTVLRLEYAPHTTHTMFILGARAIGAHCHDHVSTPKPSVLFEPPTLLVADIAPMPVLTSTAASSMCSGRFSR